jgi:glycosyltransferase involved in cell wall biosynthesis
LIKACKNLPFDYTLNIIGDGPEKKRLEQMVKEFRLEEKIHFLGILEGEKLARVLNRHYFMVIPSLGEEGFGIVALEGMACGCKIIAADAGGLSEAVKDFGKLFKMGSVAELEELLVREVKEFEKTIPTSKMKELEKYLAAQNKKAVALEYLKLFE